MSTEEARPHVAGVLLAAGDSSRLGTPKQLLEYRGEPLVVRAARAALDVCPAGLVVVTGARHDAVAAALAGLPLLVRHNPDWAEGMGASVRCGVAAVPAAARGILLWVCDQPRVGAGQLGALVAAFGAAPDRIAAAAYAGTAGVPAVFPAAYRDALAALQGRRGARAIIADAAGVTRVDMPEAASDVDTPDDVAQLGD